MITLDFDATRACQMVCVGAQLTLFDTVNGWRHTCFITNTPDTDLAGLVLRHRGHARVEDRVRNWKNCGLANLPFEDFTRNQAWCAISLLAGCLLAWTQHLCLDGHLAKAEPKTLRYRLLHVAARLVTRSRQTTLRIDSTWPWRHDLATAYAPDSPDPGNGPPPGQQQTQARQPTRPGPRTRRAPTPTPAPRSPTVTSRTRTHKHHSPAAEQSRLAYTGVGYWADTDLLISNEEHS